MVQHANRCFKDTISSQLFVQGICQYTQCSLNGPIMHRTIRQVSLISTLLDAPVALEDKEENKRKSVIPDVVNSIICAVAMRPRFFEGSMISKASPVCEFNVTVGLSTVGYRPGS